MIDLIKKYVENRIQLVKLELVSTLANVGAGMVSSFLIFIMVLLILFMFSLAFAFWLSAFFESEVIGFAIVGGVYTLIFIMYMVFGRNAIDTKVKDEIVKAALAGEKELNEFNESSEL